MTASIPTEPQKTSRMERKRQLEHHFAEDFDSLTYPLLADIYISEGQIGRAKKVCLIGLDRHPNHPAGLYLAATLAVRDGDLGAAEKFLLQTLQADEYHVGAAELLVAVQERLKRKKPVLEQAYKKLIHANPLSRAAHERLDHLLAEKKMLEDIRRDLAGLPPEQAEIIEKQAPPPVPEAESPLPPEQVPVIPTDPAAANHSWEDNVKRLAGIMTATGENAAPETEAIAAAPSELEVPEPEGTAMAALEEITEEEPPVAELDQDVFEVPAVEREDKIDGPEIDESPPKDAKPGGVVSETETTKQVVKEEIFEPGVATEASLDSEREHELIDDTAQERKETDFDPGRTDSLEIEEDAELATAEMDEEADEEISYPSAAKAEPSDESALRDENDRVKPEEATFTQPDIGTFEESVAGEPDELVDDIEIRATTDKGDPVSSADKQDQVDEHEMLIDSEQDSLIGDESLSITDETSSAEMLSVATEATTGEAVISESQREEESFDPGSGIDQPAPPHSVKDQEARAEEPYQPEGKVLARDTVRENEFLEDYAEPMDLGTEKADVSPAMEERLEDEQEDAATSAMEASDDSAGVGESFEPGAEADQVDTVVEELDEAVPLILSQDESLPSQPTEATGEEDSDLVAEPDMKDYPEVARDRVEEEAPVSPAMMDDGAAYWAEALDSEGKPFESQKESDTRDEIEDESRGESGSISTTSEETDEFEPGQTASRPEVSDLGDETEQAITVDEEPGNADRGKPDLTAVELVDIESDSETEKTEIEKEKDSFDPGKKLTGEESLLGAEETESTPPRALDQDDLSTVHEASVHDDQERHAFVDERITEPETGETETASADTEMISEDQELVEDVVSQEDSFEPTSLKGEGPDTDEPDDLEESIPASDHEEPYQPDRQPPLQEMKDIHLDEAEISEGIESDEAVYGEPEPGIDQVEQPSSEELAASMEAGPSDETEAFEPGATEGEETAPDLSDTFEESTPAESDEDSTFEPGQQPAATDESEIEVVGKDFDSIKDTAAEKVDLPEVEDVETDPAHPLTSRAEGEDKPKDQFEPGRLVSEETPPIGDELKTPGIKEESRSVGDQEWEDEPLADESFAEESDLPDIAVLGEEQGEQQEDVTARAGDEEDKEYVENATISTTEPEGGDLQDIEFAPGESPSDENQADPAAPDSEASGDDLYATHTPGLPTADESGDDDLEVLEKAAYDSQEMRGESFEPSSRIPTQEDTVTKPAEDADLIADEDEDREPALEEDRDDVPEEQWLDPKLATFTLATIYKVQGLYQQALQVLDLMANKGADPDRIAAERDSILQQMGNPSSD